MYVLLFEIPGVSNAKAVRFLFCLYVQIRVAWHVRASSPTVNLCRLLPNTAREPTEKTDLSNMGQKTGDHQYLYLHLRSWGGTQINKTSQN